MVVQLWGFPFEPQYVYTFVTSTKKMYSRRVKRQSNFCQFWQPARRILFRGQKWCVSHLNTKKHMLETESGIWSLELFCTPPPLSGTVAVTPPNISKREKKNSQKSPSFRFNSQKRKRRKKPSKHYHFSPEATAGVMTGLELLFSLPPSPVGSNIESTAEQKKLKRKRGKEEVEAKKEREQKNQV